MAQSSIFELKVGKNQQRRRCSNRQRKRVKMEKLKIEKEEGEENEHEPKRHPSPATISLKKPRERK